MIRAVNPRGQLRFLIVDGRLDVAAFNGLGKRLLHGATKPVPLIVEGHPTLKPKKSVRHWHHPIRTGMWTPVQHESVGQVTVASYAARKIRIRRLWCS